ncbi:ectonucleoside triphosphate diphosphohydrolase 8-like [Glandiceps talaboti]
MFITVHAVLGGRTIRVPVEVESQDSVESLIAAFCIQQGYESEGIYILRNEKEEILDNTNSLALCGIEDKDTVYLTEGDTPELYLPQTQMPLSYNPFILVGIALICIGIVGLVVVSVIQHTGTPSMPTGYGLVWDAGSTHSKLHIYQWPVEKEDSTAIVSQIDQCKAEGGGISSYTETPSKAGESLKPCMDKSMKKVPANEHNDSLVMLGATAGMRLIEAENKTVSDEILASVDTTLRTYPYNVTKVDIISGEEEGSFSWVTVNYLLSNFGKGPASYLWSLSPVTEKETVGALDMGGASLQITFIPEDTSTIPAKDTKFLKLYGVEYTVYTHSYLCYGVREAERRFLANLVKESNSTKVVNPCAPIGHTENRTTEYLFDAYCSKGLQAHKAWGSEVTPPSHLADDPSSDYVTIEGSSDTEQCASAVSKLLNTSTFLDVYKAPVYGKYYAFSTFYYTTSFLNLTHNASLLEYSGNMTDFCKKSWDEVKVMPTSHRDLLPAYCFQAQYIFSFLTDSRSYHFDESTWNFEFIEKVDGLDLGWSLGFMINTTNLIPAEEAAEAPLTEAAYLALMVLFSLMLCVGSAFMCYAWVRRRSKLESYKKPKYGAI